MRNIPFTCLTLVVIGVTSAMAQSSSDFEPILLPVSVAHPVPGAFGSLWATDFRVTAVGGAVHIQETGVCGACPTQQVMVDGGSLHLAGGTLPGETPGELIWLSRADGANARFNLRVRDLSRESQTWGTEVPVVRESQYRTASITLVEVPLDARFRVTLRAYDPDVHTNASFRFDFRDIQTSALLASRTIGATYKQSGYTGFPRLAACAVIGDVRTEVSEVADAKTVRVDITPVEQATRFWAFASVTNDETQHVTLVTPQQQP
jgi:hypothetical protein